MTAQLTVRGDVSVSTSTAYSFRFEPGGWAIFTVNDGTGEFSIQSDWGNYGHRWHTDHLGKRADGSLLTLTEFLARASADYIVNKLSYDRGHDFANRFDAERTLKGLREHVIEYRRDDVYDRDTARALWDDLDEWFEDLLGDSSASAGRAYMERVPSSWVEDGPGELWDWAVYGPSPRYVMLVEQIVPAFQRYLRPGEPTARRSGELGVSP